jgi:hypothetical protein
MTVYLNTYRTWQAYGGPEEGGFWYECGEPVQSIFVSEEDLPVYLDRLQEASEAGEVSARLGIRETCQKANQSVLEVLGGQGRDFQKGEFGGYMFGPGGDEDDAPIGYDQGDVQTWFQEEFAASYPTERPHYE